MKMKTHENRGAIKKLWLPVLVHQVQKDCFSNAAICKTMNATMELHIFGDQQGRRWMHVGAMHLERRYCFSPGFLPRTEVPVANFERMK